ncbi:MAG: hypothetical protein GYB31_19885 [Bacteroidetes bacterium]|nr:hypothetical protein [Bacteroidota bacterium]
MRISILIAFLFVGTQLSAQIPIRNYIGETEKNIVKALEIEGLDFEVVYDSEDEYYDGEQLIIINAYGPDGMGMNDTWIYLYEDKCYQIQYNFYGDDYVLESIRKVIKGKKNFYPCSDMSDCWSQEIDGQQTSYYWNLFDSYEGDETWKVLIIEDQMRYEENRYMYEWDKY